jgi:UDP-N-acetylglucosamine 2-epimerase (non-hydrolysing)/GDP/UDP-N,N'-diacetylbacillosamine 2-epimerase (hydrolysing)
MANRRICIVTGTRAEYGLLYWLMREIQGDPDLELQVIATGMHLSPEFGLTYRDIEDDGFEIDEKVEMLTSSDTPVGIAKSMGLGTIGFADALSRLDPDVLVLLGDRYEILSVAQAALVDRIPIAHIHGGEITEGAVDDSIRHAVTKMAHVHFTATEPFRRRVIQLGERPERVFNVGAPGLDYLRHLDIMGREELESSLDFDLGHPTFLITYHPATLQDRPPEESLRELLDALDQFPDARLIFTRANADAEGRKINQQIEKYVEKESDRAGLYSSLGQRRYLSALHHVDLVLGNSSSGLTEAPAVPVPTVNLGTRQRGRPRAESVIDCREQADAIAESIREARSESFRNTLENVTSPYGDGKATPRIRRHLKEISLEDLTTKSFYDVNVEELSTASVQDQHS